MTESFTFQPFAPSVYVLWGEDRRYPIYVGQSIDFSARMNGFRTRSWYEEVEEVEVYPCEDRKAMRALHFKLVRELEPLKNVEGASSVEESNEPRVPSAQRRLSELRDLNLSPDDELDASLVSELLLRPVSVEMSVGAVIAELEASA